MDIAADPHVAGRGQRADLARARRVLVPAGARPRHRGQGRAASTWPSSAPTRCSGGPGWRRPRSAPTARSSATRPATSRTRCTASTITLVTSDWREPPHAGPRVVADRHPVRGLPGRRDFVVYRPARLDVPPAPACARAPGSPQPHRHRVRPGHPRLPGAAADPGPVALAAGVQGRQQLRGLGLLHAQRRRRGVQRGHDALGRVVRPATYGWGISRATTRFTKRVTANVLQAFAEGPPRTSTRPTTTWRRARARRRSGRHRRRGHRAVAEPVPGRSQAWPGSLAKLLPGSRCLREPAVIVESIGVTLQ